jgi:transposase
MKTNSDTTPGLYIGLDVHKEKTSVAIAEPGAQGEVHHHGNVATTRTGLERMLRRIVRLHGIGLSDLAVCYEAGGCGMWIARRLAQLKVACTVVAPSLIPVKAGDKVKTDRRDAIKLARLLRAGELVAVRVPDETDEAIRDLCRARVDAVDDLRRAKARLLATLRRLGHNYQGKTLWTEAHKHYLRSLSLPHAAHRIILEELIAHIGQLGERIPRLESQMELLCAGWQQKPLVDAIMALKGFQLISAMMIVSEVGCFTRFTHPRQIMGYLGLTSSEDSSADKQSRGRITKCGNSHARWILVESATHYKAPPRVSHALSKRQEGQPRWIREISWKAQNRLNTRFVKLRRRLKNHNKIKVAIARELAGVIWEIGFRIQSNASQHAQ